jgi:hypothetical protein
MTIRSAIENSVNTKWFYHTIFYNYVYIICIPVILHPDDGHKSDQNMLAKANNTWLNIFMNVHF